MRYLLPAQRSFLTPYTGQQHAQQAVPSSHNAEPPTIGHAPSLTNVPSNPSAITPKNIVRGVYARNFKAL